MILKRNFGRGRARGVALIVTLVLLSLLVLVILALVGLTRVESSSSQNVKDASLARANAVTSLNIALGQLQKLGGPDQRTTARGDLLSVGAPPPKEKNLTAIWDTSAGGNQLAWLVSGSETKNLADTLNDVVDPTGVIGANDITLVGGNSVQLPEDYIVVTKQPIMANPDTVPGLSGSPQIGNYAYWIGDEGAKISLSATDPTRRTNPAPDYSGTSNWQQNPIRERLNQQMLPQPQVQNLHNLISTVDISDANTVDQLSGVMDNPAFRFVTGFPAANQAQRIRELFYDVTAKSEAVLVDPTTGDGRLKIDLSDSTQGPAAASAYAALTPSVTTDYEATYDISKDVYPVVSEGSIRISFYRDGNDIRLAYRIDVEMWNPYAAILRYNDGSTPVMSIEVAGLPTDVDISSDGTPVTDVDDLDLNGLITGAAPASVTIDSGAGDLSWQPGEIKKLSSNGNVLAVTSSPTPGISSWLQALGDAGATTVTVDYSTVPAGGLEFRLKVGADQVAAYKKPDQTFDLGSVSLTTADWGAADAFKLGYGFQFADTVENWSLTNDPRGAAIAGSGFVADTWTNDTAANAGQDFNVTNVIREANFPIVLFDLPRQEVVSVGQLRHMVGGVPSLFYDRYFYSTVPPAAVTWDVSNIRTRPLPNRYVRLINPIAKRTGQLVADTGELRNGVRSARYLLQTGAFNVNSTSVAAWRALLGAKIVGWKYSPTGGSSDDLNHAFFRLPHGGQILTNPLLEQPEINDAEDTVYVAGRELSDVEVRLLAEKIVERSKAFASANHPFFSLADFINNNVIANAIQDVTSDAGGNYLNNNLAPDRRGTPADLTQSDVIAAIAPFITPRSDTFKIRAYGDVFNPVTQEVSARAWCEAIVQRVPDLAEDLDADADDVADPNFGGAGTPFGRKFIIISFRWLSNDDI